MLRYFHILSYLFITVLFFTACNPVGDGTRDVNTIPPLGGGESNEVKRIYGNLGSEYGLNISAASQRSQLSSLISVNEIWALPLSKTDLYYGAYNVTFDYSSLYDNKQTFRINDDGTFDLLVKPPCHYIHPYTKPEDYHECFGQLLVLVDKNAQERKNQIKGFLSLDGEHSLIQLPYAEITDEINYGTLHPGSNDEVVGRTIEDEKDHFQLDLKDLELMAQTDDFMKMAKNIYINPDYSTFLWYSYRDMHAELDKYTAIQGFKWLGYSFQFGYYGKSGDTTINPDTVYAPDNIQLVEYDENATIISHEDFNATVPFTNGNHSVRISETRIYIGDRVQSYLYGDIYDGWSIRDIEGNEVGYLDLTIMKPFYSNGISKSFVPSLRFVTNSEGKIDKIQIKWYLYSTEQQQYVVINDYDLLWKRLSRATIFVADKKFPLPMNGKDIVVSPTIDPTHLKPEDVQIQYGFYGSEVSIQFKIN